jgi:hypothetical protein
MLKQFSTLLLHARDVDCAIAILASFSPLIATALVQMFYTSISLSFRFTNTFIFKSSSDTYFSILISNILHHDLYEFQQFERLSHDQPLLFLFLNFSCSATEILASFIAFAAASFPKASIYPDSSLISVTLTLINFNPILIQNQHFLKYFLGIYLYQS